MGLTTIGPSDLYALLRRVVSPSDVIDVRTPAEFGKAHVSGARSVPLDVLDPDALMAGRTGAADRPLYIICRSGGRSRAACGRLHAAGHRGVVNVEGGMAAWVRAGLPVETTEGAGASAASLDLPAGLMTLAGIALGLGVHPAFYALAATAGAMLIIATVRGAPAMLGSKMTGPPGRHNRGRPAAGA